MLAQAEYLREQGRRLASWLAIGLAAAAEFGSLPPKMSAQDKQDAAREVDLRRRICTLRVLADDTWEAQKRARSLVTRLHPSHKWCSLPGVLFCSKCGAYSSGSVRLLGKRCDGKPTSQRKTIRDRLLLGMHPKSRHHLGDPVDVELGDFAEQLRRAASLRPR